MAIHELKRTFYDNANDSNINHNTLDHRQDMIHYHVPLMRMHNAALHQWGVAVGLQVTKTGSSELTIAEGLAIDVEGRMLTVATEGQAPGETGKVFVHNTSPGSLKDVPTPVSTQDLAAGPYYVTMELATTFGPDGEVEGRYLFDEDRIVSTPLIQFQPSATFPADGSAIILATVEVSAAGDLTGLSGADRQFARLSVGDVVVRRGTEIGTAPDVVGDRLSGRLSPLSTGGLRVEVPEASDQIQLQREGRGTFAELLIKTEQLRVTDSVDQTVLQVNTTARSLQVSGDLHVAGAIHGELAAGLVGETQLANAAVSNRAIETRAVTSGKIADSAVTATKIASGSVGTTELAAGAVTELNLTNGAVSNRVLRDSAVTETKMADGSVGTTKLANDAVISLKIANNAITTEKVQNNAITTNKIDNAAVTLSKIADGVLPPDIGIAVTAGLQDGQSIPIPSGFTRSECVFYVAIKYLLIDPDLGRHVLSCNVDSDGVVSTTEPGRIVVMGFAIAKKGGW